MTVLGMTTAVRLAGRPISYLLTQVAEGVVGYFRRTFQNHKFCAVSSPLRVEVQLISEAHSLVTFLLILLR